MQDKQTIIDEFKRLKEELKEAGCVDIPLQKHIAEELGVTVQMVSCWFNKPEVVSRRVFKKTIEIIDRYKKEGLIN